jgi:hypothetical protein
MPVKSGDHIRWLDASGYRLAISPVPDDFPPGSRQSIDYDLIVNNGQASVVRV